MALPVVIALVGSLTLAAAVGSFAPPRWVAAAAPVAADLTTVAFTDTRTVYAVGAGGTVLRTADGGATWSSADTETTSTLRAVDVSSAGAACAVGDGGAVLVAADGTSWAARSSGVAADLLGVDFVGASHGWAVGRGGTVIATADGGRTWSAQVAGMPGTLRGVAFTDARSGWAWGDDGTVVRTTDAGLTWKTARAAPTGVALHAGAFLDSDTGWVAGSGGIIRKTTDGGATWTSQTLGAAATIHAITFIDAAHGFLVGGDSPTSPGVIAGTADGGATWTLQAIDNPGIFRAVRFADAEHGWIVGDGGTVLRTVPKSAPTLAGSTPALAAPTAVYARAMRSGEVVVGWTEWVGATAPTTHRVWRSVDGGDYVSLALVRATDGPAFTDANVPPLKTVAYKVSTIDPTGESGPSVSTSVVTKAPPEPLAEVTVGMTCTSCHAVHYGAIDEVYPGVDGACVGCHAEIGDRLAGEDASTRHDLLSADQSAHGSRIACENCHNAHILSKTAVIADPDEPSPSRAMPRVTNGFCLACHDEALPKPAWARAPLGDQGATSAGDIAATWGRDVHGGGTGASDPRLRPDMGYAKGEKLACVTCHDPHGSTNRWALLESVPSKDGTKRANGLLVRPLAGDGADLRLLCSGCHLLGSHPTAVQGGADLTQWPIDCTGCHAHGRGLAVVSVPRYTLTYAAGAGGAIVGVSTQVVDSGSDGATVTATPSAGYHFVSWSDGVTAAVRADRNVTGDVTVSASFVADHVDPGDPVDPVATCTLTYTAGTGGTIVGTSTQVVDSGSDGATVTATPNTGYHFVTWSDGATSAARADRNVTGDVTVSAVFAATGRVSTRLREKAGASSLRRYKHVTISSILSPAVPAGTHVRYQLMYPGGHKYVTISSTRDVSAAGYSSIRYKLMKRGTYRFRARFMGIAGFAGSISNVIRVVAK